MLAVGVLRFVALMLGASLHVFLSVLLAGKRRAAPASRLMAAAMTSAAVWQAAQAIALVQRLDSAGRAPGGAILELVSRVALAILPPFLLHLAAIWARVPARLGAVVYLLIPAAWWTLRQGAPGQAYAVLLAVSLAAAAMAGMFGAAPRSTGHQRWFFLALAAALLLIPVAGLLTANNAAATAWISLVPAAVLLTFVYRYNVLELQISRRVVFAATLGMVFALYLVLIRTVAEYLATENEFLRGVINLILTFAAGLIWLPLSGWMTRFLERRTRIYRDFSRRVVEDAARILDLRERLEFLAEEIRRTFRLRKAVLVAAKDPNLRGEAGSPDRAADATAFGRICELAASNPADGLHGVQTGDPELRPLLDRLGFNYVMALRYDGRPVGALLLDTSPRLLPGEDEQILAGLGGQISQSIANCLAIEEKISLERTLARQEHLASLGQAAAALAHEIKNPLSSIRTLAQLMKEDPEAGARFGRDLSYMIGETDRLNRSLQQLLSFSRPSPERRETLPVSELLDSILHVAARQCREEGLSLQGRVAPGLVLRQADPEAVKQIVLNLLANALQAAGPGGRVEVEAGQTDRCVFISVCDSGPGIPPAIQERIFEPFFTTRQKGTGLGLAIVRKHVRQMGGEIRVDSPVSEGRGARMTVTLPAP